MGHSTVSESLIPRCRVGHWRVMLRGSAASDGRHGCAIDRPPDTSGDVMRVEAWERRSEIPLLLLAVAFLVAYAWPILDPNLDRDAETVFTVASWTVWAAFVVDFVARIVLADDRRRYVVGHWYDVALVTLPMLRPLRLLRLIAFIRVLNRSAAGSLAGRVMTYVVGAAVMSIGLGALAVLDVERGAEDANITTAGDALWWATTTVTTVGYGDYFR
jgi:voltage-gated potassium channel